VETPFRTQVPGYATETPAELLNRCHSSEAANAAHPSANRRVTITFFLLIIVVFAGVMKATPFATARKLTAERVALSREP
jgi:hypothetical protein